MRRAVALMAIVLGAIVGSKLLIENVLGVDLAPALQRWFATAGTGSALAIVGLLGADLFLPIPSSLVMILSGAAFGLWWGALLALVGSIGGEWLGFELVRRYGRPAARRFAGDDDLAWLERILATHGAAAVFISRALPILMEAVSVVAGLSTMSRRTFLWTSLAGTAPIVLVYANAGAMSRDVGSIVPAVVILVAVAGGAAIWFRVWVDRRSVKSATAADS
jgi:uncharacterized membrane protein YdjX (TVP38/TMEM64 family)